MTDTAINLSSKTSSTAVCHLMPCRIESNQKRIRAKEYFWPTIRKLEDGKDNDEGRSESENFRDPNENTETDPILVASFRGRPLQGRKIKLPDGFRGHVRDNDSDNCLQFNEFTYWNWDEIPKQNDTVLKALQWLDIAKAIHE